MLYFIFIDSLLYYNLTYKYKIGGFKMTYEELKNYCISKKGAFEDYPFGDTPLVIKIASKMFSLISHKENKLYISLKCDPFLADNLRSQYPSIPPGYHLNKIHWNKVFLDGSVPENEICWMINHSYEMVLKTLTKSQKKTIGIPLIKFQLFLNI